MNRIRVALLAGNEPLVGMLERFAATFPEHYETQVFTAFPETPSWACFDYSAVEAFRPDALLVWNALNGYWRAAARMCDLTLLGGGRLIEIENGWFPQRDNWLCRPVPMLGEELLALTRSWAPQLDLAAYMETHFPVSPPPCDHPGYLLAVGQVCGDANTVYSGDCFTSTEDFERYVDMLAGRSKLPIFFAPHPKAAAQPVAFQRLQLTHSAGTLAWAQHATAVVGLSSTALFESLAYGIAPIVLGRPTWWLPDLCRHGARTLQRLAQGSLKTHPRYARLQAWYPRYRQTLAMALALQFPAEQFSPIVERLIRRACAKA